MMPVPGERDIAALGEIMNGVESPPLTTCVRLSVTRSYKMRNDRDGECSNKSRIMNSALTMAGMELFPARRSAKSSMRQAPLASQLP